MKKMNNILFLEPMLLETYSDQQILTEVLLTWPVYLENYLKSKIDNLNYDLLYLPDEKKKNKISIKSYSESEEFAKQMSNLLDSVEFEIDQNTYILLSGTTSYYYLSIKLIAEYFQKYHPEAIVILGGAHASACPQDFAFKNSGIDYIFIGEGERVLYEAIKQEYSKQKHPKKIIGKPILDLDKLPSLDLSILNKYIPFYKSLSICLSRGCPFNCSFCQEQQIHKFYNIKKRWRAYSPQRAIEESKRLIEHAEIFNIKEIGYVDATFGASRAWLNKFLELWDFNSSVSAVWTETRFDILNERHLKSLKDKGFFIWYGLESMSPRMLNIMNKQINPIAYVDKYKRIIKKHVELDYVAMSNVIFGHPGETKESYEESFKGLKRIKKEDKNDIIQFSLRYFHYFPGNFVFNNIQHYMKTYGTKIFYPYWWKDESLLHYGPYMVNSSRDLNIYQLIENFSEDYEELGNMAIENLKKTRPADMLPKIMFKKRENKLFKQLGSELLEFIDSRKDIFPKNTAAKT
ncbi:MAG: B12-binding domain-containing radical SAM protein [Promethearchaeota archaeon]|nr:MAG: B12-binding domain-containing radical SAM protein [Candidatus Lokiarchaeota archaeon]